MLADLDVLVEDPRLEQLKERYEREGVDTRLISEPFIESSEFGDADSCRRLLEDLSPDERRSRLRAVDQHGRTGLILAASKADLELTDVLLDCGANPNDADSSGSTALHYAACKGATAIVDHLLRACADAGRRDDMGEEPLMWASGPATVSRLLDAGAECNAKNINGRTALMCLAARGDIDSVKVLSEEQNLDLNACDSEGRSARALAEAAGHEELSDFLASQGSSAGAPRPLRVLSAVEALHDAARRGDSSACSKLLSEKGCDVNAVVGGETALLLACGGRKGRGSFQAAEVLLDARADPNRADTCLGETPLMRTVLSYAGEELLWMLLECRADPLKRDRVGRTPCEAAAAWKRDDAVAILEAAVAGELPLECMD